MRKALNWGNGPFAKPKGAAETFSRRTCSQSCPLTIHDDQGLLDNSSFSSFYSHATVVRGWLPLPLLCPCPAPVRLSENADYAKILEGLHFAGFG